MEIDNDVLQYNKYISFFTGLYNYIMDYSNKISNMNFEPERRKTRFRLFHHSRMYTDSELQINEYERVRDYTKDKIKSFIFEDCKIEDMLSFASMWQFCQFIRYAEKTIFLKNRPESNFYVDSDMIDVKSRVFIIKNEDTEIIFKLEKIPDEITKTEFKTITLNIKRLYGKQMTNIFTIVNEDVKCNDSSDLYLINTVNKILYDEMLRELEACVEKLLDIYDLRKVMIRL